MDHSPARERRHISGVRAAVQALAAVVLLVVAASTAAIAVTPRTEIAARSTTPEHAATTSPATALGVPLTAGRAAKPAFRLPFECGISTGATTYDRAVRASDGYTWNHWPAIDMAPSRQGLTVVADAPGHARVIDRSEGKVLIDHGGGWTSLYQHMQDLTVDEAGRNVQAGEKIGAVGNVGKNTTGAHLHYSQREGGQEQPPTFTSGTYSWGPGRNVTQSGYTFYNDRSSTNTLTSDNCGAPDSDGDGIPDPSDGCPTQPGPSSHAGCPAGVTNGGGEVKAVHSGKCLDLKEGTTKTGTTIWLFSCNTSAAQDVRFVGGQVRFFSNEVRCMDASDGSQGKAVVSWPCNGSAAQDWRAHADGTLRLASTGRCLDARNAGTADGTIVQVWECNGSAAQQWLGFPTPNGGAPLKNPHSGRCVDVPGGDIAPGTRLQIYDCNTSAAQQWKFEGAEVRVYRDKCLDVANAQFTSGTAVQIWPCNSSAAQQWSYNETTGALSLAGRDLCLDVSNAGTVNGAALQVWECNGSGAQVFTRGGPLATPSPTVTSPPTSSPSPTASPTPSATPTATSTPTPSPTSTVTPSPSTTPTSTPTTQAHAPDRIDRPTVKVKGKPQRWKIVLAWSRPDSNGAAITEYRVLLQRKGAKMFRSLPASSTKTRYTVKRKGRYKVTLHATNSVGTSKARTYGFRVR